MRRGVDGVLLSRELWLKGRRVLMLWRHWAQMGMRAARIGRVLSEFMLQVGECLESCEVSKALEEKLSFETTRTGQLDDE